MDDAQERALVQAACDARDRAYAPYSKFTVGAALVADDGATYVGANVENASYGLTVCAERTAIWNAVLSGARRVTALAVASGPGASMCGACRQVLAEFADPSTPVLLTDEAGAVRRRTLEQVLPDAFTGRMLADDDR